ncbi:2OG-Fe(II) oxygenase [Marilutibacter alkalisoli]|uniref:Redoxin domain-containing protein n=1 Tax=Marilutibacter alkalisoli TaxID=2591633 RepID=A0A514BRQ8_9GAMM|nr:2OG-Fe(II) oxygenase [Lysobacter alkalisoli]QDH70050.1 redoxin domain-containing protein [Lysobacter alkalisoli]
MPRPGEPAPWFKARSPVNPNFSFDTAAGRRIVLFFFGSAADIGAHRVLETLLACRERFDDRDCAFFGVSVDPEDERSGRIQEHLPGFHLFWDFDQAVSRLYGVTGGTGCGNRYRPTCFVLDERLRVAAAVQIAGSPERMVEQVMQALGALPPLQAEQLVDVPAPVLIVPRIFEPGLCRTLIQYYEERGGEPSGFMRDIDGQTVLVHDARHKRRCDRTIEDETLRQVCMHRIHDRLLPEIEKAFQYRATRIERYIVACYDEQNSGHFRAHRDNTTRGTAHRRFAVSINLNAGEYEGGVLRFPEFGWQMYRPPTGGALAFSCSLLHEATPVTRGKRYAFLPFLYDEQAAAVRASNSRSMQLETP